MTAGGFNRHGVTPMRVALGLFGLTVGVSYIAGHLGGWFQPADVHQRTDRLWRWVPMDQLNEAIISAADRGLLALAGAAGILLLTAEGMRSWRDLELLTTWVVRFAGIVAGLGVLQYFTGLNVAAYLRIPGLSPLTELMTFSRSDLNRVISTAGHPIELGVIMAGLLPIALHHSIFTRKITAWIPTMLIGMVVLMSVSRSAILVAVGAMLIMLLGWPNRWRLRFLFVLPFALVAARAVFPGLLGTIRALFTHLDDDPSIDGRTADYAVVFRAFLDNPLFGQGYFTWVPMYFRTLDNQFLVLLLELGAVGALIFVGLIATGVYSGFSSRKHTTERNGNLGLSAAAGVVGIAVSFVTFDTLAFRQATGVTFLLLGMAGAAWILARRDRLQTAGAADDLDETSRLVGPGSAPPGAVVQQRGQAVGEDPDLLLRNGVGPRQRRA
jgi:O-antigen ligase